MPNLTPTSSFDDVPELETATLALGGPGGPMNLPAQALLNRTQWLKDNAVAGSSSPYAVGTGTANACAAAYAPAITALADGMKLRFVAAATNTGAATFAPDALTAQPIVGGAYAALQGGEILAGGEVELTWNATLGAWVITAQAGGSPQVPNATQSKHAASKAQVDSNSLLSLGTRADAIAATVPSSFNAIRTSGYTTTGDGGGALYHRVASLPSHPGYFQSADGAYWEIAQAVISPMMLGASSTTTVDSYQAITDAIAAAVGTGAEMHFDRTYGIATTLSIPANAYISSRRGIALNSLSGLANGVLMAAGNHVGKCGLPNLVNFSGIALDIRCALATIYVSQITGSAKAIRYTAGSSGVAGNVLDTIVVFDSISSCTQAVEYYCETTACIIQGSAVRGNFITDTINGFLFSGAAGAVDGQDIDVLAMDFTTGGGYFLNNTTGASIPRLYLQVRSWFGGNGWTAGTPTQFVSGTFDNASINLGGQPSFSQSNFARNIIRGSNFKFRSKYSLSQTIQLVNSAGLAGFNGGIMQWRTEWVGGITLGTALAAGATTSFYFYHVLADNNYPSWEISVFSVSSPGLVIDYIRDQTATEDGRVALLVRNSTGSSIASGASIGLLIKRV